MFFHPKAILEGFMELNSIPVDCPLARSYVINSNLKPRIDLGLEWLEWGRGGKERGGENNRDSFLTPPSLLFPC